MPSGHIQEPQHILNSFLQNVASRFVMNSHHMIKETHEQSVREISCNRPVIINHHVDSFGGSYLGLNLAYVREKVLQSMTFEFRVACVGGICPLTASSLSPFTYGSLERSYGFAKSD